MEDKSDKCRRAKKVNQIIGCGLRVQILLISKTPYRSIDKCNYSHDYEITSFTVQV